MKKMSLLVVLSLVGCGSIEGNWTGECENPATGELRSFDLDIDVDKRSGIEGSAFMTIYASSGDIIIQNCIVTGDTSGGEADLDFTCGEDEESGFSIDFVKDGDELVGYCDSAEEVELRLIQD